MIKPSKDLIDSFLQWFSNDPHKGFEDYYHDSLSREALAAMKKEQFVDFIVEFVAEGGKIQSGGHRKKNQFKDGLLNNYEKFRDYILRVFDPDLDVHQWLRETKNFKYFGRGIATIFLNRVDKNKYVVVNNKTSDALRLFGISLPGELGSQFDVVTDAQTQLIQWYPELDNFFRTDALNHFLIGTKEGKKLAASLVNGEDKGRRYWICSLGRSAKYWEECYQQNIAVFGFDQHPALSTYKSKEEVADAIKKIEGRENAYNDALAGWQIVHEIKPGDILIVKKTRSLYLGYGVVSGDYYYDETRESYRNIIPVQWKKRGEWKEDQGKIVVKTLTDVTPYGEYVKRLVKMMEIEKDFPVHQEINLPKNLILYGPPGTGKTHRLRDQYFKLFTDQRKIKTKTDFAEEIASTTGWWEIIAMVMLDLKTANVTQILEHPLLTAKIGLMQNKSPRAAVWAQLQSHTKIDCQNVNYTKRFEPLVFWKDEHSVWSIDLELVDSELKETSEKLRAYLDFKEQETIEKRYVFTTFHQSYSYEEFVEGIKPRLGELGEETDGEVTYEIKPGVFKQIADRAIRDPDRPYAIFIDEISRGNVASIFGELITLIEDDKRKGAENEMSAILPYSREEFFVPANLHIICTMNTADRSVIALDNALRRRFCFEELMPDPDVIDQPEGFEVELVELLETINGRIERLLDRDHVIGHSYFMGIAGAANPLAALQDVFANKVLPLLQEYFYGDPGKIGMVLGKSFVKVNGDTRSFAQGVWGDEVYEDRQILCFTSPYELDAAAFQSIYAT